MKKAIDLYKGAACQDYVPAQKNLVRLFKEGAFTLSSDNIENVEKLFGALEKEGDATASFICGYCYENGLGVERVNYKKAVEYYEKAADKGHVIAQKNVSLLYEDGFGCDVDLFKALKYSSHAAFSGDVDAKDNALRIHNKLGKKLKILDNKLSNSKDDKKRKRGDDVGVLSVSFSSSSPSSSPSAKFPDSVSVEPVSAPAAAAKRRRGER